MTGACAIATPDDLFTVPPSMGWGLLIRGLGQHVRALRKLAGLSQQELAAHAHISQGAVSRVEAGECDAVPLRTIFQLFAALGTARTSAVSTSPALEAFLIACATFADALAISPPPLDPRLRQLLLAYHAMSEESQVTFVQAVLPLAKQLRRVPPSRGEPPP